MVPSGLSKNARKVWWSMEKRRVKELEDEVPFSAEVRATLSIPEHVNADDPYQLINTMTNGQASASAAHGLDKPLRRPFISNPTAPPYAAVNHLKHKPQPSELIKQQKHEDRQQQQLQQLMKKQKQLFLHQELKKELQLTHNSGGNVDNQNVSNITEQFKNVTVVEKGITRPIVRDSKSLMATGTRESIDDDISETSSVHRSKECSSDDSISSGANNYSMLPGHNSFSGGSSPTESTQRMVPHLNTPEQSADVSNCITSGISNVQKSLNAMSKRLLQLREAGRGLPDPNKRMALNNNTGGGRGCLIRSLNMSQKDFGRDS